SPFEVLSALPEVGQTLSRVQAGRLDVVVPEQADSVCLWVGVGANRDRVKEAFVLPALSFQLEDAGVAAIEDFLRHRIAHSPDRLALWIRAGVGCRGSFVHRPQPPAFVR